ncbi:HAD-superfamily hydrolase, subfamily IA, variant 1 [Chitinophaga pinensis DSM 2588]|uniref:HAD-superfamily hydrolase, subfamily IA, variant 1 n=2 Tax=Chitinophaga pinensis TaxID=79329 RepID=A0A979G7C0_CHIPD|nr:HAD-superfamily hydrolase, subfamily IA, variant 1 [Chitinophaga pinensis DSM 2588]
MLVFDMAGTTINEDNLVYKTLRNAINEAGFSFNLEQVLAEGAGKEKKQAIRAVLSTYAGVEDQQLTDTIYKHFIIQLTEAYAKEDISAQPYAADLFAALKERNILRILNTGYDRQTATNILHKIGWQEGLEYDALVTASDVPRNRPEPDMILFAMQQFHINDSSAIVKVGDSTVDIEEGKNAGCGMSIGITTGAHTKAQLETAGPDYIISNLMELLPLLR